MKKINNKEIKNKYPKNQKELNELILETSKNLEEIRTNPLVFVDILSKEICLENRRKK